MANQDDKKKFKQEQRQTRRQEYKHQQDSKAAIRKDQFQRYPKKLFYPSSVYTSAKIPEKCIFDGTYLSWVENIKSKGNPGWCCMRCLRQYKSNSQSGSSPTMPVPAPKPDGLLYLPDTPGITPKTAILAAKIQSVKHGDIGWITIVSDAHDQDTPNGIFWVGRTLPSMVLAAIQSMRNRRFEYREIVYQVTKIKTYQNAQKYLNIIARFCNPSAPQTVFLFAQKNISHIEQENYESVIAMVPCADRIYPVPMPVYYDKVRQYYFVNDATYNTMRRHHGLPYLRVRTVTFTSGTSWGGAVLKQNSELNLLGYNVGATNGLPVQQRRRLLRQIIDSGILSKHEVTNHIEWLIHFHGGNPQMVNAILEWESDLQYLASYQAGKQRTIWVEAFRSRFSGIVSIP